MTWHLNFHGQKTQRIYNQDDEVAHKAVVKMFRELTHEKPPRGRPGRHLPQDQHLCVVIERNDSKWSNRTEVSQTPRTFEAEVFDLLERHNGTHYKTNETDLRFLQQEHDKRVNQTKMLGVAGQLSDLMTGLMGLGAEKLRLEEKPWTRPPRYAAVFEFNDFIVRIDEKE